MKSVLDPFVLDMKKISEKNVFNNAEISHQSGMNVNPNNSNFRPPIPLPISHNDWSQVKEGYSYTYSSKIPVNMKNIENETGDIDKIKARY
jgi:hypothetical protein